MNSNRRITIPPTATADQPSAAAAVSSASTGPANTAAQSATPQPSRTAPTVPALQGLSQRARKAVFGREVNFNAVIPGVGGTIERPMRAAPPPKVSAATSDESSSFAALSAQAQGLQERASALPATPWERPARTKANRWVTAAVPWLKPNALKEKAAVHGGLSAPQRAADVPHSDDAMALALQHRESAEVVVQMARDQLRAAQTSASPVQEQRARQALSAAEDRLSSAIRAQHAMAGAGGLQPLAAQAQRQTHQVDKHRFVGQRLEDTRKALAPHSTASAGADASTAAASVASLDQAAAAHARAEGALPNPADALSLFAAREAQAMQIQAKRPRGFAASEAAEAFGTALQAAVLKRPANPSPDALPSIGVMEVASDLISLVCKGDAHRAQQLLTALQSRPTRDWMAQVPDPAGSRTTSAAPSPDADVHRLLRQASVLPRGAEVVHLLGDPKGTMPDSDTLQAMRTFWSADAAQQVDTDASVRQWLAGAKRVAREQWAVPAGAALQGAASSAAASSTAVPTPAVPPNVAAPSAPPTAAERAAYNAVRNGCLSNAADSPLARHDARMRKAIDEWIVREQPSVSWAQRAITPHRQKTPFTRSGLQRATAIAESFGMTTARSQADSGIRQTADQLADWARTGMAADLAAAGVPVQQAHAFAQATQALTEQAAKHDHPSAWRFQKGEAGDLRAAAYRLAHPTRGQTDHLLRKPNRDHALPPLFEELARDHAAAPEALRAVIDHLKLTLADAAPSHRQAALTHDPALHAAVDTARQQRFQSKEDVVRYFEPILLKMQLRDKLKLSGGGIVGGGLPSLPYGVPSPVVSPVFSAGWSRKEEAFFQVFMPILGMEISLGDAKTSGPEATVGIAARPDLPGVAKVQVSATEKMSRLHQHTEGTLLRLFRQRGRDDEMRAEMLGVLDSWVRWDQVHPPGQAPYAGPLEAVLDRHPKISLGEIEGDSLTRSFVSKVSAGANLKLPGADGEAYRVGANAGVALKAERIAEARKEHGGHISVNVDQGDTAQQRLSVGVQVNTLTPANASEAALGPQGRHGTVSGGGLPGLIEASRDVFWNLEKHAVSPFTIGGKQDADLDRHYSTAADMLAEIRQHREDWLARCIETLEPDATGEKNTPQNRDRAESLLRDFEAQVQALGRESRLCQYNVNYSLRSPAAAWVDTFRALEGLSRLRGDAEGAAQARANADRTLQQDATWRPLMLIVREKGKDQRTHGWNFGVRLQRSVGVEGQRTAAQFPPP